MRLQGDEFRPSRRAAAGSGQKARRQGRAARHGAAVTDRPCSETTSTATATAFTTPYSQQHSMTRTNIFSAAILVCLSVFAALWFDVLQFPGVSHAEVQFHLQKVHFTHRSQKERSCLLPLFCSESTLTVREYTAVLCLRPPAAPRLGRHAPRDLLRPRPRLVRHQHRRRKGCQGGAVEGKLRTRAGLSCLLPCAPTLTHARCSFFSTPPLSPPTARRTLRQRRRTWMRKGSRRSSG